MKTEAPLSPEEEEAKRLAEEEEAKGKKKGKKKEEALEQVEAIKKDYGIEYHYLEKLLE